ncbi:hypothetical protein BO86DRAFT_430933 [Aspergillus japonicus CBS 114.51]|uniref:Zn(2)-C6 fungal-type domain-containing protein n=1 Tax=Aspergillus japonicus CBS 114.51 TaxID=1448312 RepID=A0A8T8X0V2_ASPJA|nr:hypothetical protein BO86DRAFT_430933 [Aspergillus japonicus CBS 114.51]RAH81530.1 hypothetical protein BO86DRAFT_430933 [Aspergillus japonicus CBS 114.51]
MSDPLNPPRPRKRTKTFTGCWTCRARKIKCDEGKPSCHQCYHKGLTCEGYSARLHWLTPLTDRQALHSEDLSVGPMSQPHRRLLPAAPPKSPLDYDQVDGILRYLDSLELVVHSRTEEVSASIQSFGVFGFSQASSLPPGDGDDLSPDSGADAALSLCNSYEQQPVLDSLDEQGTSANSDLSVVSPNAFSLSPDAFSVSPYGPSQPLIALGDSVPDGGQVQVPDLEQFVLGDVNPSCASQRCPADPAPQHALESLVVPRRERLLMHHYRHRVVNLFCVIDNSKSPWKTIHLPRVLQCAGELSFGGTTTRIRDALRKSLLSISAFYLSNDHRAHHRLADAERWDTLASRYRCDAIGMLKYAVETDLYTDQRPKYKEFLATMLSMVTINVMSGDTSTCGVHLDGAGKLIAHMSSLKSTFSRKAQSLHRIYLYLRVIYESTAVKSPHKTSRFASSLGSPEALGPQPALPGGSVYLEEDESPASMTPMFASAASSQGGMSAHESIYGIPQSLLLLLKEAIEVIDELQSRASTEAEMGNLPGPLSRRCDQLEQQIMDWPLETRRTRCQGPDGGGINATIVYHQTRAFLNALVIFFAQGVRRMSHRYLRQYVQAILESIEAVERLKAETKILAAPLFWPAFIGATEAFDPLHQDRFRLWYVRVEVYGIEAVRTGIEVLHEVWRLGPTDPRHVHARWRGVVEARSDCLMLT